MKKLLATLVVAVLLAGVFSGCYMTKAGKLKDIVGTYELKSYSRSGDGAVNYMERDEIVCYLVVKDASSGYYIYKDKNNPLSVREVMITLTPDTEEPNKYEFVTYKLDTSSETKLGYAGGGLNSTTYQSTGIPFTSSFDLLGAQIHTSYSRVDKATDLSYVTKQLGELPKTLAYGVGVYDGFYVHSYYDYNLPSDYDIINTYYDEPFIYAYVDLSLAEGKATVYYALKSNPDDKKVEVYDASVSVNNEGATVTIGSKSFKGEIITSTAYIYFPTSVTYGENNETLEFALSFNRQSRNLEYLDQMINDAIENYKNSIGEATNQVG